RPHVVHAGGVVGDQGDPQPAGAHGGHRSVARPVMTRRLSLVFAHPDDDTFGLGGTIAMHRYDLDLQGILATSGEAGMMAHPSLATRENLGEGREGEARASDRALRVQR